LQRQVYARLSEVGSIACTIASLITKLSLI